MNAVDPKAPLALTVCSLQYWWSRAATLGLYADVADRAAATVVLGEVVCMRRNEFKLEDWLALARELAAAGKTVHLATQVLVMSEAELRALRRIAETGRVRGRGRRRLGTARAGDRLRRATRPAGRRSCWARTSTPTTARRWSSTPRWAARPKPN
jgi:hypothetical protein